MESKIPVPTDNIFKFYALFGLLLFVFSFGSVLYVNNSANEVVYASLPELEGLKQIQKPSAQESAKIALLTRKLEITKADKGFYINASALLATVAMLAMVFGFWKWHTAVQPILDESAKVQLEIARLQLKKLQRDLGISGEPVPPSPKPDPEAPSPKAAQTSPD